jgi:hypothetical protein
MVSPGGGAPIKMKRGLATVEKNGADRGEVVI